MVFKFLKNLFKEKEQQVEEVKFDELDKWLLEHSKPINDQFNMEINDMANSVTEKLKKIIECVEALKNAKLPNPNIPERAKQYMEGNREFYTNSVASWVKGIAFEPTRESMQGFVADFDKRLDELNKSTVRSYTILQEFFANESSKIAEGISELNAIVKKTESVLNSEKMQNLDALKSEISRINTLSRQKDALQKNFKELQSKISNAKEEHKNILKSEEEFSQSAEFLSHNELKNERDGLIRDMSFYEDQLIQSFGVIERALRKYSHIAFQHEEIALRYIISPLKAMSDDRELVIIKILKNIEKKIDSNEIKLDEQKKSKTLEELKKLDEAFIRKCSAAYGSFIGKIENLDKSIYELDIANRIEEIKSKIANSGLAVKNLEQEAEKLKSSIDKINIDALIKSLEDGIIRFIGKPISLKIS